MQLNRLDTLEQNIKNKIYSSEKGKQENQQKVSDNYIELKKEALSFEVALQQKLKNLKKELLAEVIKNPEYKWKYLAFSHLTITNKSLPKILFLIIVVMLLIGHAFFAIATYFAIAYFCKIKSDAVAKAPINALYDKLKTPCVEFLLRVKDNDFYSVKSKAQNICSTRLNTNNKNASILLRIFDDKNSYEDEFCIVDCRVNQQPEFLKFSNYSNLEDNELNKFKGSLKSYLTIPPELISKLEETAKLLNMLPSSDVRLAEFKGQLQTLSKMKAIWEDVALDAETIDGIICDIFDFNDKKDSRGILLYGPSGTGKSFIIKAIQQSFSWINSGNVTLADLKGAHIGHTAPKVKEQWALARSKAPFIMCIDECDSVFKSRDDSQNDSFSQELVNSFISEWDGIESKPGQVFVIGSTNRKDALDSAVISRFHSIREIRPPDASARKKILHRVFKKNNINLAVSDSVVSETTGLVGRSLEQLAVEIARLDATRLNDELEVSKVIKKFRSKNSYTTADTYSWEDIVLKDGIKKQLMRLGKHLKSIDKAKEFGVDLPKGILLYGPPGTGKTQIARVLANQSGLHFESPQVSDLKQVYVGASGNAVKNLFDKARANSPSLVFIDEIDLLTPSRNSSSTSTTIDSEILSNLLQEMDGMKNGKGHVLVMASTNCIENVDSALLSRFSNQIEVPLPDENLRVELIKVLFKNKKYAFNLNEIAEMLAIKTEGLSGRDLTSLVNQIALNAFDRGMDVDDDFDASRAVITEDDVLGAL